MYQQRVPEPQADAADAEPPGQPRRLWQPDEAPLADVVLDLDPSARYVAVDHIEGPIVTLAVAPWPSVDPATGRLDFGPLDGRSTMIVDLAALQERADGDRAGAKQLLRPIRVSDVFMVSGMGESPAEWDRIVDVTRAARFAAKAALFATASGAPPAEELEDYGIDEDVGREPDAAAAPPDEPTPPPGPIAYPAV
jgi:hypothetical protein